MKRENMLSFLFYFLKGIGEQKAGSDKQVIKLLLSEVSVRHQIWVWRQLLQIWVVRQPLQIWL
jgi:hypothetical protein